MTENAFYPLFLLVALVLVRVLERPSSAPRRAPVRARRPRLRDARAGGRARAGDPRRPARPRGLRAAGPARDDRRATAGSTGSPSPAPSRRSSPSWSRADLLGAYAPVGDRSYDAGQVLRYLWWHVAELSLYVLVVPLAALDRARRARSLARRAPAGVPRGDGLADGLRRRDRRDVRVRVLRPDRGAEHVLRRAALLHRAPRLDRAGRSPPAGARGGRGGDLGAARRSRSRSTASSRRRRSPTR